MKIRPAGAGLFHAD